MQNESEVEKLSQPQIAMQVAVYTIDQGTTNPVGASRGFSIHCKRRTMPHPRGQSFLPKID